MPTPDAKHLDEDRVRAVVAAGHDARRRRSPASWQADLAPAPAATSAPPADLDELELSLLADLGLDPSALDRIHAQARARTEEKRHAHRAAVAASAAALAEPLRAETERWRRTVERLASLRRDTPRGFDTVVLDTPAFVYPAGEIDLRVARIQPWDNAVKVSGQWAATASGTANYVFAWTNPNDTDAIVDVESYLTLRGGADIYADRGLNNSGGFGDNKTFLVLDVDLGLYVNDPNLPDPYPPYQTSQLQTALALDADGGGLFGVGHYEASNIGTLSQVTYKGFVIPPRESAVFTMTLSVVIDVLSYGYAGLDLAGGDAEVNCPALVIVPT